MNQTMSSRRVCIYLADLVHTHVPGNYVVPLNVASVSSYMQQEFGNAVEIVLFKYPEHLLRSIEAKQPDILGLSNYFWNNELNKKIGTLIHKKYPQIMITMGGPSIRTDANGISKFLSERRFLDLYILFEGEKPFANLVHQFINDGKPINTVLKPIKGCASLSPEGNLVFSPPDILSDLEKLPSPYLSGLLDKFLLDGLIPMFESNRGCPYSCTFCTWGISALKKVRRFSLDRIFDEMEYVACLVPESSFWIFADANFGIFERDIEIAKRIGQIRKKNPSLSRVTIWTSKNNPERNKEIAHHIGNLERPLIAVQTWDPIVQKNIKRDNITPEDAFSIVKEIKREEGREVATDVLCGFPGETYDSHIKTLKMAFEAGFDFIDVGNILMLPGSELETDESRKKFNIRTKYRIRQGSYGKYDGKKAIEYEEIIRSTNSFDENQMVRCRLLHWLIWLGWNAGFFKPLLLFLQCKSQVNPIDFLLRIITEEKSDFPHLKHFFDNFICMAQKEWFDSPRELLSFYDNPDHWNELLEKGFAKMNFENTAELILFNELREEFYSFVGKIGKELTSDGIFQEILTISKENHISPQDIISNKQIPEKSFEVAQETISYFHLSSPSKIEGTSRNSYSLGAKKNVQSPAICGIILSLDKLKIETIRKYLLKFGFATNPSYAIQKTLEPFMTGFQYTIRRRQ